MQSKVATYLMYALLIVGFVLFAVGLINEVYEPMLFYAYVLSGVAVVGILLGSVIGLIQRPSAIKTIGIGVGGLLVLYFIGNGLADDSITLAQEKAGITAAASQWSGAILYMLYIVLVLSIVSILYSLVARLIR